MFTWTVSAGKIVTGQGTRSIIVDTSGLAGETISVAAEVNDGSGLAAIATCEVHVLHRQRKRIQPKFRDPLTYISLHYAVVHGA